MGAKTQTQPNLKDLGVDAQLTDRALRALLKHHESSSDKEQLLGNDLDVQVQFSLARIPGNASPKPIRIELPHPLVKTSADAMDDDDDNLQDVDACIIVKEESKEWVQELITRFPTELGCIKKVLGLQSLRIKHKSFTQRRELLAKFDVFFADDRILPMLARNVGGKFFDKKKQPIPVSLTRKEALPFAIQKALQSTFMYISAGTCVTVKAGSTGMSSANLLANIKSITTVVPTKVPRKWSNIRSISIKTSSSVALPIYNKTPEELELIMELAKKEGHAPIEEKKEDGEKERQKKRKSLAASPLAKALKKSKAVEVEAEKEEEVVEEKPKKSSKKKKKKEPVVDAEVEEKKTVAKTPKSSKKKEKKTVESKEEEVVEKVATTTKSSKKKKKKEAVESNDQEEEVVKEESKTPKSTKKRKSKEDDSTAASSKKTPKKSSDEYFIFARKFTGAKKGYVFKKSKEGIGYYKDSLPEVDKTWFAGLSKKAGRGGGRKSVGSSVKRKKGGRKSF